MQMYVEFAEEATSIRGESDDDDEWGIDRWVVLAMGIGRDDVFGLLNRIGSDCLLLLCPRRRCCVDVNIF
jgi:hypothetical protein